MKTLVRNCAMVSCGVGGVGCSIPLISLISSGGRSNAESSRSSLACGSDTHLLKNVYKTFLKRFISN